MAQQIAHNLDESRQTHNVFPEAHNGSGQQVLQDAKSTSEAGQSSHVANPTMATEKVPFVFASEPVMSNQTNGNNDSRNNTLEGDQFSRGQIIILNKKENAHEDPTREENAWKKLFRENIYTDKGQRLRENLRSGDEVHIQANIIPPEDASWV